ncbi:MAG: hypothetical protein K6E33_05675, partial [Lachnospiraceae bacterium]|nr:hypothetical protein [Lachnospiraceae bacterium]
MADINQISNSFRVPERVEPTKFKNAAENNVRKETEAAKKTQPQNPAEEKEPGDLVYMSDDGDTVRVSAESNSDLEDGIIIKTEKPEEDRVVIELQEKAEEAREKRLEAVKEEMKEQEEKAEENAKSANVTSFAGLSDSKLEQMYLQGIISRKDYESEIEARKNDKEQFEEDSERISVDITNAVSEEEDGKNTESAIENAFYKDSALS